jgi:hypothetical protein
MPTRLPEIRASGYGHFVKINHQVFDDMSMVTVAECPW